MTPDPAAFSLAARLQGEAQPVLTGVHASGRLDGVLFELTLRQTFRNPGLHPLEVIYTFPLPPQAVLLDFAAELQGQRLEGQVVAKAIAERQYEDALASGDAPVMLERLAGGIHTANIGNLAAGEEVVLELRIAQVLAFEQGRLRLAIPSTIAPRYGQAEQAGLQPQQVPQSSLTAEYPLTLSVIVSSALSGAVVSCPTHPFQINRLDDGVHLDLAQRAWLDRDVVITVTPRESRPSLLISARDTISTQAPIVAMATLQPPQARQRPRIALKLLVDCSGSMAGDGIYSARRALRGVIGTLQATDAVSLSRFGSTVEHLATLPACTPEALRQLLAQVDAIDADLGGTEMEDALQAVFALPETQGHEHADVLLMTDGAIWQADELVAAARDSGHRVFAIGVGAAPAEGLLRSLAEATGGACEFATAGESLEAAATRMLGRIRQQPWADLRIDWGGQQPIWQTATPRCAIAGDTVVAFAGLAAGSPGAVVRLMASGAQGSAIELARSEADAPCSGDALARIAAERRMATAEEGDQLAIAVDYQLMSGRTNCILVHRRAEADKTTEEAEMHRVSSMAAAGWGSILSESEIEALRGIDRNPCSMMSFDIEPSCDTEGSPSVWKRAKPVQSLRMEAAELAQTDFATLRSLEGALMQHLLSGDSWQEFDANFPIEALHLDVQQAFDQIQVFGLSRQHAWVLLAQWIQLRTREQAGSEADATLQSMLSEIDPVRSHLAIEVFDRVLGGFALDDWSRSRAHRVELAMRRAVS